MAALPVVVFWLVSGLWLFRLAGRAQGRQRVLGEFRFTVLATLICTALAALENPHGAKRGVLTAISITLCVLIALHVLVARLSLAALRHRWLQGLQRYLLPAYLALYVVLSLFVFFILLTMATYD